MDSPITRAEHEEFRLRMEDEHSRINHRLCNLEETTENLKMLNTSIEKLAVNMEAMLKEQRLQGARLEKLESRDGEMWRKVTAYIITTIAGIALGYLSTKLGI